MKNKHILNNKFYIMISLMLALVFASTLLSFIFLEALPTYIKIIVLIVDIILMSVFILTYIYKKEVIYKAIFIATVVLNLVLIIYLVLTVLNVLDFFYSTENVREFILGTGAWGLIIFISLQFIQVVLIPIPAIITTLAGVAIYGPFLTAIVSTITIIVASLFNFFIWGRLCGVKVVEWVAGKETTEKYCNLINKKGKLLLPLMFLFPFFPDDLLCSIAGLSKMSALYFIGISILFRPISIFIISYFGSGIIIPFSGWGLYVWPFILVGVAVAFLWSYKNQDKIENYMLNVFGKNKKASK